MFRHILDQPPLKDTEGPIGLVMAPARELAFQIFNEAKKFTKALGLRVACIYGECRALLMNFSLCLFLKEIICAVLTELLWRNKKNNIIVNCFLLFSCTGGAGVAEQIADLKRGAEIVVCTPGRMIDILCMQVRAHIVFLVCFYIY